MINKSDWQRVSKSRPCPICGKPDWCMFAGDSLAPTAAICARVESPKRCGQAGWLHKMRADSPYYDPPRQKIRIAVAGAGEPPGCQIDFAKIAAECRQAASPASLDRLASGLGLSPESLARLSIGWSKQHRSWTFPMVNKAGAVVGIRLRRPSGQKWSVAGGHEGLFLPEAIDASGRLMIVEGPTDAAALLDMGFSAVGRPSCSGGTRHLVGLLERYHAPDVVIVADGDIPGQRGAESLASVLVAYSTSVRVITPPVGIKDIREWKCRGAKADDVQALVGATPVRRLKITCRNRRQS